MSELITMTLVGQTEAGSAEVQPARDSQLNATNCRWDGGHNLPSHFMTKNNSELCNALKNLIKKAPPKAASVPAEGRKSLKTKKWICPFHAEPVQKFLTQQKVSHASSFYIKTSGETPTVPLQFF